MHRIFLTEFIDAIHDKHKGLIEQVNLRRVTKLCSHVLQLLADRICGQSLSQEKLLPVLLLAVSEEGLVH